MKINVLHITSSLRSSGGIEETIRVLSRKLDPARFRVGICVIQDRYRDVQPVFNKMGVDLFCLNRRGYFFDLFTVCSLYRVIERFKAQIVHTHTNKGNLHGRVAAFLRPGVHTITTHHDLGDVLYARTPVLRRQKGGDLLDSQSAAGCSGWLYTRGYPFLNILLNRLNDRIITVSDSVRQVYTADPTDKRFVTVYAPYDEEIFLPNTGKLFTGKQVTIGTVGRLVWKKGHIFLLRAMPDIVKSCADIRLKIIGDGPLRAELESFIEHHNLASQVELCGNRPHDAMLYEDIDIYVQPSLSEGCSITLLEAMGSGIPVIASDIDGPRELITSGQDGILVPAKDPDALAAAVIGLLDNRQKTIALGRAGQQRAHANFSSRHFVEKIARLYQEVVAENKNK